MNTPIYSAQEFFNVLSGGKSQLTANNVKASTQFVTKNPPTTGEIEKSIQATYGRKYLTFSDISSTLSNIMTSVEFSEYSKTITITPENIVELLNNFLSSGYTVDSLSELIGKPLTYDNFIEYCLSNYPSS